MLRDKKVYELESGRKVAVSPVPAFLMEVVQSRIPLPRVPIVIGENGEEWENPTDPDYLAERDAVQARRISAAMMAAIVYGVELLDDDGAPTNAPNDGWERKLRYLGIDWRKPIDGMEEATGDEDDIQFARNASYLLYWLLTQNDVQTLMKGILVAEGAAYEEAVNSFPGDTTRRSNRRVSAKRSK